MDISVEVNTFLTTRRDRVTPDMVGLPTGGRKRRVAGLRREEVAQLAGMSVDYYTRLERGNLAGASEAVLDALARVLQLTEVERGHLYDLAATANNSRARRRGPAPLHVRPQLQRMLDSIQAPAWVRNGRGDILAGNRLGLALYSPVFVDPRRPANTARFTFLDPRAADFFPDWSDMADGIVAGLRTEVGRNPFDGELTTLIGELSTRSDEFRRRWAAHDVYVHQSGAKRLYHPVVGEVTVTFEAMQLASDEGLTMFVYGTEADSASEAALRLLDSWSEPQLMRTDPESTEV